MLFTATELTPAERALQGSVREFLDAVLPRGSFEPGLGMSSGADPAFSRALAARGWLGMAVPARYGGHDGTSVDRFVVTEELLAWGAPLGYHWVADRQTAPVLLRFGTEEQKQRFLPAICRGELSFCIGMSEPDAGSDLAAVRTRGTRVDGGWLLAGTKVWTSNAARADFMIALCRTGEGGTGGGRTSEGARHDGLSQFLVDMRSPGITINPIPFLDGSTAKFAEVVLDAVFVPDELVVGEIGKGWAQNTSELAYERGGPDRWISTFVLVREFLREHPALAASTSLVADVTAQLWGLRRLSLAVARIIDAGGAPAAESALVKEMGTRFEQDVVEAVREVLDRELLRDSASLLERLLCRAVLEAPSFTIRGGTTEVLRSVAAKGLR